MGNMQSLQRLDVSANKLVGKRDQLSCTVWLCIFIDSSYVHAALPKEISSCINLVELNLYNNKLKGIPPEGK